MKTVVGRLVSLCMNANVFFPKNKKRVRNTSDVCGHTVKGVFFPSEGGNWVREQNEILGYSRIRRRPERVCGRKRRLHVGINAVTVVREKRKEKKPPSIPCSIFIIFMCACVCVYFYWQTSNNLYY